MDPVAFIYAYKMLFVDDHRNIPQQLVKYFTSNEDSVCIWILIILERITRAVGFDFPTELLQKIGLMYRLAFCKACGLTDHIIVRCPKPLIGDGCTRCHRLIHHTHQCNDLYDIEGNKLPELDYNLDSDSSSDYYDLGYTESFPWDIQYHPFDSDSDNY
jgi:hypothetical protein